MKTIVQISLDLIDIPEALETARMARRAGVDWLEAGTPLISAEGMHGVRALRREFRDVPIVADLKTMDGGWLEAKLMAEAGATHVVVMERAHPETVKCVVQAGHDFGVKVMGETCPQYLFFTIDDLRRPDGAKWICSPPMRSKEDNDRLWEGLSQGILQTVGTDHCPFFFDGTRPIVYEGREIAIPGKELGKDDFTKIPNGLPGVEDRLPVMWTCGVRTGKITANQFVAYNSTNPARIFGLYPRKGALLVGSDADIVIWDPEKKVTYGVAQTHHRTDYNLYEGWELTGMPEKVLLRGKLIVDAEQWLGKAGDGQFLKRDEGEVL